MLRRVNAALFEAPAGARIEVVADSRDNNGVTDARFEYAGTILPRDTIAGLPGCRFVVGDTSGRLQAVVAFDPGASASARYDLSEVENGVLSALGKFTLKSDGSPLIDFVIDPVGVALGVASATRGARAPAAKRTTAKQRAAPRKARPPKQRRRAVKHR